MFLAEMALFTVFLIALTLAQSFLMLVVCLLSIGLALGCDDPTAHMVISEAAPSRGRGGLVLGVFAFQAVGAICGAGLGFVILSFYQQLVPLIRSVRRQARDRRHFLYSSPAPYR
jgi:MFS family permease